ncbi:M6 family metalloprotease domain-containing protein [Longispora albida]|uniref:M6 family metalloprotease domain-containing protein n=1 Tax=Longispora albida TaxID=203523 RepID=UPI00037712D5|nr:M6 family metalloprotease domain-containing protein [Longispora albida]
MRNRTLGAVCSALLAVTALAAPAQAAITSPAEQCRVAAPPEGWPGGGVPGYNTRLHHGIDTDWANQARPIGDVRAIMLFVDFPNARASGSTATYYNHLVPGSTQFFRDASYGQFRLTVDAPQRWYRMSRNDRDYELGYIVTPEVQARYISEAMRLADAEVDFSRYQLVYVVPSRNATAIPYSPEWNDYRGAVVFDGRVFRNGVTFGQDAWHWGYKILNHETGHDTGLPELYNATGSGRTFQFTGDWGVMGNIAAEAPDFLAWEKWKLGWVTDSQIACVLPGESQVVTLSPIETAGGRKAVVARTGRYTAWVAEVRQRTGVDSAACDKGVLVYKVDASRANGSGSIRVADAHPSTGVCGDPLNDAAYDLGPGEIRTFSDPQSRTRIELLGTSGGGYTLRVSQ